MKLCLLLAKLDVLKVVLIQARYHFQNDSKDTGTWSVNNKILLN